MPDGVLVTVGNQTFFAAPVIPVGSNGLAATSGRAGSKTIADTATYNGAFSAITFLSDSVFTTLTGDNTGYGANVFPKGLTIFGSFTSVKLASGAAILYT